MSDGAFSVRVAGETDFDGWFELLAAVAAERRWIGREPPLDREEFLQGFRADFVAADGSAGGWLAVVGQDPAAARIVGSIRVATRRGSGDIGMVVDAGWRGQGVGTALMAAAVDWARDQSLHKLSLQLWPHNIAARKLYEKFGFVQEGYLRRQYRRQSGELWDAVVMGLVLDESSPGSSLEPG